MVRVRLMVAAAACLLGLAGPLVAAEWPKVEPRMTGDIGYVNGGFGIEERQVMPTGYPLKLVFATEKGHLLSNVTVTIFGQDKKKVVDINANDGPWLLLGLKPGRYSLEAMHNGFKKTIPAFEVPARGTKTVLVAWKISEVDMGLPE